MATSQNTNGAAFNKRMSMGASGTRKSIGARTTFADFSSGGGGGVAASGRMSMASGGGRASMAPRHSLAAGRQSLAVGRKSLAVPPPTGGGSRRSSANGRVGGGGGKASGKKDPRTVQDKAYMQSAVRNVLAFLTEQGYEYSLTPEMLWQKSSGQTFQSVFLFLYCQIDPNFELRGKMEEEIPAVLRSLKYPVNISKSAMQSLSAPHAWPTFLAILDWLTNVLRYDLAAAQPGARAAGAGGGAAGDAAAAAAAASEDARFMFEHTSAAYLEWLEDESRLQAIQEEMEAKLQTKHDLLQSENNTFIEMNTALQAQIDEISNAPNRVAKLEEQKEAYTTDYETLRSYVDTCHTHRAKHEARTKQLREEIVAKQADIAELQEEKKRLQAIVEEQERNDIDADKINKEKSKLEDGLSSVNRQKEQIRQSAAQQEQLLAKRMVGVDNAIKAYDNLATQLKIYPADGKIARALGTNFQLKPAIAPLADTMVAPMSTHIKEQVKPALAKLKDMYTNKKLGLQEENFTLQEELEAIEEQHNERLSHFQASELKLKRLEARMDEERAKANEYCAQLVAQEKDVRGEIEAIAADNAECIDDAKANFEAMQKEYAQAQITFEADRERFNRELVAALDVLMAHKQMIQEAFLSLQEELHGQLQQLQQSGETTTAAVAETEQQV